MSTNHLEPESDNSQQPLVGIVLVAYNSAEKLNQCIQSIFELNYNPIKIYIHDNSTDETIYNLDFSNSKIEYTKNPGNYGFCKGTNQGLKKAFRDQCEYIWILNYDTTLDPNCLITLINTAKSFAALTLISGKILLKKSPEILWFAGGKFSYLMGVGKHLGKNQIDSPKFNKAGYTGYASGCCFFAHHSLFESVGLLNEDLFMYLDDAEYCLRVKAKKYKIYYEPQAVIYHDIGTGLRLSEYSENYLYYSVRNKPRITKNFVYRTYLHFYNLIHVIGKIIILILVKQKPISVLTILLSAFIASFQWNHKTLTVT